MVDGPLKSKKFRDNDRLQKCAQFDSFHVTPRSPASDHVAKIQEALREVDGANIPASEKDYGDFTIKAVVAFKTKHRLFTRGTQTIDPITGTGTSRKLDELLLKKEPPPPPPRPGPPGPKPPGPPVPPPPPPPPGPIIKDPVVVLSGQCQLIGELKDNPQAPDLQFADPIAARKSLATTAITAPFVIMDDGALEGIMNGVMVAVAAIAGRGDSFLANAEGLAMCQHFYKTGNGTPKNFAKGSAVSNAARDDVGGAAFVSEITFVLNNIIRRHWKAGRIDDRVIAGEARTQQFKTGKFAGALTAFIGGFQGFRVEMCNFSVDLAAKTFSYTLDVQIFDHFGVDETDINRGAASDSLLIGGAMGPFFVMQHDRSLKPVNFVLRNYRPFRVSIRFDTQVQTGKV
ncbi:hypothetical protein sos41_24270 [Alphaproteobacteria bacterium SO-S41]|nr:hypothetical protein sos41_24270 [Alphaproteobacteria bacterium SO-S41]